MTGDGDTRPTDRERLTEAEVALLRTAVSWSYPPSPDDEAARQAADHANVVTAVEQILAARAPAPPDAAQARPLRCWLCEHGVTGSTCQSCGCMAHYPTHEARERRVRSMELQDAIEDMNEEQRRGVADGRADETLTLFQHWSATRGWLASRLRALQRGDEPNWPDAMNSAPATYLPAEPDAATLDRVRRLLRTWERESVEHPSSTVRDGYTARMADLRAALDGDTDQCGDPGDDEHGGGA